MNCHTVAEEIAAEGARFYIASGAGLDAEEVYFNSNTELYAAAGSIFAMDEYNAGKSGGNVHIVSQAAADQLMAVVVIREKGVSSRYYGTKFDGLMEVVYDNAADSKYVIDERSLTGGAVMRARQTVVLPEAKCNGGRQPITPDPEPEPEFVEVNGLPYTYCFEDGWPWIGDYDMNDVVVVVSVDRRSDKETGKVGLIRINWELKAAGAAHLNAFAIQLDKVRTSEVAGVETTNTTFGRGAFAGSGPESGSELAVIPLFNTSQEILGEGTYINTTKGVAIPTVKHTTTVTFAQPYIIIRLIRRYKFMDYRIEHDSMGEIKVPADKYWAAQTQRSHENFEIGIGIETMPREITQAFGILKKAAAIANNKLKKDKMTDEKLEAISKACDEVIDGKLNEHFPLVVWQTGSGTQSNMNANEVIANRGNEIAGKKILHPNDDINMSQSSNDTFPTAMSIAAVIGIEDKIIPAIEALIDSFKKLEKENEGIVKSGRTHLQDATPITFSQEISGWRSSLEKDKKLIEIALPELKELALGGTAVGTGLNAPKGFDEEVAKAVCEITGKDFVTAENKFHALTSKDEIVFAHGALKALACDLMKIANDIRWLASGPRLGLGEITIPENEPGSSIMPGKVNPTQCEAVTMVSVQVMGNDAAIGFAASQGNFELNVFMPVTIYNFLQSVRLLSEAMISFNKNCVSGIKANKEKMDCNLHNSLMLVTALNPYIGYENAAKTAKYAYKNNISLKEACTTLGFLSEEKFEEVFHPEQMV